MSGGASAARMQRFEARLREEIPLTNHLGFQQLEYDGASLAIHAALQPNHNDKGTAFAGSLSACANLCGWGLITLFLEDRLLQEQVLQEQVLQAQVSPAPLSTQPQGEDRAYDVVIRDSRLEYLLPVTRDFCVRAVFAGRDQDAADISAFIEKLASRGKARMDVRVEVWEQDQLCLRFSGAYVALRKKQWL